MPISLNRQKGIEGLHVRLHLLHLDDMQWPRAGPRELAAPAESAEPSSSGVTSGVTPPTQAAAELAKQSAGDEAPTSTCAEAEDDDEPKPVDLRALTVKDFQEAMKQVSAV